MARNVGYIYICMDHMIVLSCQFKMYVNIMLEINKMVKDGCVKRTRGVMIPLEGKMKGGIWGN